MASLIFDAHKFIRRLLDAGIEEKQAEVEAKAIEKFADAWDAETAKIMEGPFFYGHIEQREAFSTCVRAYLVELREGRV